MGAFTSLPRLARMQVLPDIDADRDDPNIATLTLLRFADVGPDNQGRIHRFDIGQQCVNSVPGDRWLQALLPAATTFDPVPIGQFQGGGPANANPSVRTSRVLLSSDGHGHLVGYVETIEEEPIVDLNNGDGPHKEVPLGDVVINVETRPPTKNPTPPPTQAPTKNPTPPPTSEPTNPPTKETTKPPTQAPTKNPTLPPTRPPTRPPTKNPTPSPIRRPTPPPAGVIGGVIGQDFTGGVTGDVRDDVRDDAPDTPVVLSQNTYSFSSIRGGSYSFGSSTHGGSYSFADAGRSSFQELPPGEVQVYIPEPPGNFHAAHFHDGEVDLLETPLGHSSKAYAIATEADGSRWIVGAIWNPENEETAVVWVDGVRIPLDRALVVPNGWKLSVATDIDKDGFVLGRGLKSGERRVFIGRLLPSAPLNSQMTSFCNGVPGMEKEGRRQLQGECFNGDFEDSNFGGWSGLTQTPLSSAVWMNGIVSGRHTIMTSSDPPDPILDGFSITLPVVLSGSYSAKLGNEMTGYEQEELVQSFVVSAQTETFRFNFAAVLQLPSGHGRSSQPAFTVTAYEGTSRSKTIDKAEFVADGSDPYFRSASAQMLYSPWRCNSLDLSGFVGKEVTVVYHTKDCAQGGHFGYVYIDDACGDDSVAVPPVLDIENEICDLSSPVIANGSNTVGTASKHFWSVQESTASWTKIGPEVMEWFSGHPGLKDILAFAKKGGLTMRCGRYYRVKLAVANECTDWISTTALINITCPEIDAGPDKFICRGDSIAIGPITPWPLAPGTNFLGWTRDDGTALSSAQSPQVAPTKTSTYKASVVDTATGCGGWDDVIVHVVGETPPIISHGPVCVGCYARNLTVQDPPPGTTILWSTGETTRSITVGNPTYDNYKQPYSVQMTNACGTHRATTVVEHISELDFLVPNTITPNGPNPTLPVIHRGTSLGVAPAYGKSTKFTVFDRGGQVIYEQSAKCEDMVPNGAIAWDGKIQGTVVKTGVYVWRIDYTYFSCTKDTVVRGDPIFGRVTVLK